MGIPVFLIGRSGTGKSTSLRNFAPDEVGIINVMGKPLPFRNELSVRVSQDYTAIKKALTNAGRDSIVIDDAGYLITDMFMNGHSSAGKGNDIFAFYNDIGDSFYHLVRFVTNQLPDERIVYFIMHEETDDYGNTKPKTIGKLLDEKVCLEGMVSILLRSVCINDKYQFLTNGNGIQKTPMGMFEDEAIDNDLRVVDCTIREFWNLKKKETPTNESN